MKMFSLNERGASSWDLVLKVLSITLVSLFAFSSGVWFGKKLSDSDHQRMALEGEFDNEVRKTASVEEKTDLDDRESLTDEEVTAAADKALEAHKIKSENAETGTTDVAEKAQVVAAKPETHSAGHSKASTAANAAAPSAPVTSATSAKSAIAAAAGKDVAPIATTRNVASTAASTAAPIATTVKVPAPSAAPKDSKSKPDLSMAHQAAVRVANNASPVAKEAPPVESRVPSSLPKTVGATNDVEFTVQVASYPTADAAKEHVDSMVKKGFPAFPVEAKINGKTWYRVSVGSFKSFNDASKFRAQLLKQADLPSAIVQKVAR